MFYSVQSYSIEAGGVAIPFSPFFQFFPNGRIPGFDVVIHQVIVISLFVIDDIFPSFAVIIKNAVDGCFLCFVVIVDPGETMEIPDKVGVFSFPAGECEFCVGFDVKWFADKFCPVFGVYFPDLYQLRFVTACLMIQDNVHIHLHAGIVDRFYGVHIFLFCAIFCPD